MIVTIRSNVTPDFSFDTSSSAGLSGLASFVQPSVQVGELFHYAPSGEPRKNLGLIVLVSIAFLALLGLFSLLRLIFR